MPTRGNVRVAKYYPGKRKPETEGYRNVLIHTSPRTLGGDLSPYVLKDEHGRLLENIWQFSKVYPEVKAQCQPLGRFHPDKIVWEHPAEEHFRDDQVLPAYWAWRDKGMSNPHAVRYPAGYGQRNSVLFSLWPDSAGGWERLDYITARKRIYCAEYVRLAPLTPHFAKLKAMLDSGINLQIIEVDGPDPTLDFAPYDRISPDNPGLEMDEEVTRMLLDDPRRSFGHGFVVAALLLDGASWLE